MWWFFTCVFVAVCWPDHVTAEDDWAVVEEDQCLLTEGFHCNATPSTDTTINCVPITTTYLLINDTSQTVLRCTPCFRPAHCLQQNACRQGAAGPTCERCLQAQEDPAGKGYEVLGSTCVSCDDVPWAVVMAGIILIIVVGVSIKNGFTASVATKMKLLLDLLQWIYLTIHIHVEWPDWMARVLRPANFATLSIDMLNLECYLGTPSYFYKVRWLSNVIVPLVTLIVVGFIDSNMSSRLREMGPSQQRVVLGQRRMSLRRSLLLLALTWYLAACKTALHTNACSDTVPKRLTLSDGDDLFLYNQDQSCETLVFQTVQLLATFSLLIMWLPLPFGIIFFTLRSKKWQLLGSQLSTYGCLYESYRLKFCFWDAVPLLMKFGALLPTDWLPLPVLFQCCFLLAMVLSKLLLVAILRPYRHFTWEGKWRGLTWLNIHNLLEVFGCLVVGTLLVCALLRTFLGTSYPTSVDYVSMALLILYLLIWFVTMVLVYKETATEELESLSNDLEEEEPEPEPELWQRNSMGTGLETKEIRARNSVLDF